MVEEGYDRNNPYCSGAVELVEGPRVVARIEGVDTLHPETDKDWNAGESHVFASKGMAKTGRPSWDSHRVDEN